MKIIRLDEARPELRVQLMGDTVGGLTYGWMDDEDRPKCLWLRWKYLQAKLEWK